MTVRGSYGARSRVEGLPVDWMDRAACKGSKVDFFPLTEKEQYEGDAIKICGRCTVRDECLEYAMSDPAIDGIWGGKTFNQRDRIRRRR